MESTHDRQSIHALRRNGKPGPQSLKPSAFLYQKKELLKNQFDKQAVSVQDLQKFDSVGKHFENFKSVSPSTSDLISVKESAFAQIQQHKIVDEDESVVSSTTNEPKTERSPLPCDSSSLSNSRLQHPEEFAPHRSLGPRKNTETAAASSTTTLDDDERLQMQEASGRRREKISGGTHQDILIGSTKETQPSSTTQDAGVQEKSNSPNGFIKNKKSEFVKPSDVPAKLKSQRSTSQTHGLETSADGIGLAGEERRLPHTFLSSEQVYSKDGRHNFNPRQTHIQMGHNLNRSPILSDVSLIPMSPQPIAGLSGTNQLNSNASLDFHMNGFSSPTMSVLSQARNLSPRQSIQELEKMNHSFYGSQFNMAQIPPGSQGPMPTFPGGFPAHSMNQFAYYQFLQHQQKLFGMSLEKPDELGRFPSPLCRSRARKRPLSISPAFSDTLDINAMIRTSPNSLLPYVNGTGLGHSRCSSAASGGSYGHLVSGGISPSGYLSGYNTPNLSSPPLQLFTRQMSIPGYFPGVQHAQAGQGIDKVDPAMPNSFHAMTATQRNYPQASGFPISGKNPNSTINENGTDKKNRTRRESDLPNQSMQMNRPITNNKNGPSTGTTNDDNETVYETNCQWENCSKEFDTQEQLVQHINNDHIHGDKKEFACHWKECARDKRPFKAQYMLVVHMRRHTGEKPHKCTFKDCTKAYSRLENLKTHLRSHTGEKPYVCEFPSCTKAFSNASDRAKHQNRTHSNEKPYVCKISGCTKRYTDPSSLRKHVKTVHGPDAHVTKRMKAIREREEKKSEINVKQEPGVEKEKKKNENNQSKENCHPASLTTTQRTNDSNPPGSLNPRSNQSSYTSGSDVTPHNSPRMTSQNNDSGVDVNVVGNDADSDGDIIVDENPLPDSTSGGVSLQTRARGNVRTSMISRHFNKKMATLSLAGATGEVESMFPDYPKRSTDSPYSMNERNIKQGSGGTEVSSTTLNSKFQRVKNYIMNNSVSKHRHMSLINHDRRDSGTVSDVSRKSSSASQYSRKSSQISNSGINVAGSYDPISLDSSRRSSSNSTANTMKYHGSNSNPPALNPYDLHHLQSKFSEIAGLPPPTPISGEPYSVPNPIKRHNEAHLQTTTQRAANFHNRSNTFLPTPPRDGTMRGEHASRRRSEDLYVRSVKTSQATDSLNHINRRASDPVPKTNQIDPNKLPSVQKHGSWSNMTPLPSIQSRNSQANPSSQYGDGGPMQRSLHRSNSSGNFFANNHMAPSQQHHQANFNQHMYHPHASSNNQDFMNNVYNDVMPRCQPVMVPNQDNYRNHVSPSANVMSPTSKTVQPLSPHGSEMMQLSPMARQHPAGTPPMSYQNQINPSNQPLKPSNVMQSHPMISHSMQPNQQNFYNSFNEQMGPDPTYGNHQMMMHGHVNNQQLCEMQQNYSMQQPVNNYRCNNQFESWDQANPQAQHQFTQNTKPRLQSQQVAIQHSVPPSSISDLRPQNNMPSSNSTFAGEGTLTPRPPSHGSTSASNRLRLTRLRQNFSGNTQPGANTTQTPLGLGSCGRPTPRVNCTPDAQIPDEFLQQEFIDSIPELQLDTVNNGNSGTSSYIKMPADSTTGPDGDIGDDIDDMMSITTNTDVTLPPMSAFSSRMPTPLMNKPYPPHPLSGATQHPASNMAISSMSSMLSTLEEENKYLTMMPPQ